jgi:hydrogenase expression/formation protein HypC
MCLGIPGRVTEIWNDGDLVNGKVDFGGVSRQVCLSYVPDVQVGEYVIIHVGFAISRLDEEEAQRTLEILGRMGDLVTTELAGSESLDGEVAR